MYERVWVQAMRPCQRTARFAVGLGAPFQDALLTSPATCGAQTASKRRANGRRVPVNASSTSLTSARWHLQPSVFVKGCRGGARARSQLIQRALIAPRALLMYAVGRGPAEQVLVYGSGRRLRGAEFRAANGTGGSIPPVQGMEKLSVARHLSARRTSTTAVPHTGAIQTSTGNGAQRQLQGCQRKYTWQHLPTATVTFLPLVARQKHAASDRSIHLLPQPLPVTQPPRTAPHQTAPETPHSCQAKPSATLHTQAPAGSPASASHQQACGTASSMDGDRH